jgi:hypothetical protein
MESRKSPEEIGRELAEKASAEMRLAMPSIQTAAALEACLIELVRLLISKRVLDPQEALDVFARASDEIQSRPDSATAVRTVERLCSAIAKLPGANRPKA